MTSPDTSHGGSPGSSDAPSRLSSAKWVLGLLFVGNLLNFYDRALPAVVLEQIKDEYGLSDATLGALASAFVLVAAVAVVPLGRLADRIPRKTVAGVGLIVWSLFTAVGGLMVSFVVFFLSRVGVGVGEASYAPATGSLLSDLYPRERRARAAAILTLGFPLGTLLAYFTAGAIADASGDWRTPFLVAAVPGFIVGALVLIVREPRRGASEEPADVPNLPGVPQVETPAGRAGLREILGNRAVHGLIVAFAGYNFAAYAVGTFLTPVLQRRYDLSLVAAGSVSGVVIGLTGLVGLLVAGGVLDRAESASAGRRDRIAVWCLGGAAVASAAGLLAPASALWQLVLFLSIAYLLSMFYLAATVPATADVVAPDQRASALGVIFASGYLLGGAGGPVSVGLLSTLLTGSAVGLSQEQAEAQGLQVAMAVLVPIAFAVAALGMWLTVRATRAEHAQSSTMSEPA